MDQKCKGPLSRDSSRNEIMRLLRCYAPCVLYLLFLACDWTSADDRDEHWNWLVTQSRSFDFASLPDSQAITAHLQIAESCHRLKKEELSHEFRQQAIQRASADELRRFDRLLFRHALNIGDIELARNFIEQAQQNHDTLRDQLDVELYRQGDRDVLKTYPRGKMTFYNAMEMAAAMVEVGDFIEAEKFVTGIVISAENDPRDVTCLVLRDIALRYHEKGDIEKAKEYADKALAVGSNQYFTGYTIRITHRAVHGELLSNLDEFAQLGRQYPGHQGTELVQLLIEGLHSNGLFAAAKRTTKYLAKKDDVYRSLTYIARAQAGRGKMEAALSTVSQIADPTAHLLAKVRVAQVLHDHNRPMLALKLAQEVYEVVSKLKEAQYDVQRQRLAYFYGQQADQERVSQLFLRSTTSRAKVTCLTNAMQAFAGIDPRP